LARSPRGTHASRPFELRPSLAVAGWAAIAAGGFALIRRVPAVRILVGIPSVVLLAVGVVVALVVVAPPSRLVVTRRRP
jgi:hypothetical protein